MVQFADPAFSTLSTDLREQRTTLTRPRAGPNTRECQSLYGRCGANAINRKKRGSREDNGSRVGRPVINQACFSGPWRPSSADLLQGALQLDARQRGTFLSLAHPPCLSSRFRAVFNPPELPPGYLGSTSISLRFFLRCHPHSLQRHSSPRDLAHLAPFADIRGR
jgi:hypothetical protein